MLDDNHQDLNVAKTAQYFIDKTNRLTIQDISAETYAKRFLPINSNFLQLGLVQDTIWVRINIAIRTTKNIPSLLDINAPRISYLDIYLPTMFGSQVQSQLGEARPYSNRLIEHPDYLYPLPINAPPVFTVYVKMSSHLPINAQIHLKTLSKATLDSQGNSLFTGLLMGILLILLISNIFFYFKSRHPMYIVYSALLFGIALLHLALHGQLYQLFPNQTGIQERIYNFTALGCTAAIVFFSRLYLNTKKHFPKIDKGLIALGVIAFLCAILLSVSPSFVSVLYLSLFNFVAIFSLTVLAVYAFGQSVPFSGYYLLARITLLIGHASWLMSAYGIIHSTAIYEWGLTISIIIEAMILFTGMIAQLNPLLKRHDKIIGYSQIEMFELISDLSSRLRRQVNIIDNGLKFIQRSAYKNSPKNLIYSGVAANNNLKNMIERLDNLDSIKDRSNDAQANIDPLFVSVLVDNAYSHFQQLDQDNSQIDIVSEETEHMEILQNSKLIQHLVETILQECKHFTDQTLTLAIRRHDLSHEGGTLLELDCSPLPTHIGSNNQHFDMGINYIRLLVNHLEGHMAIRKIDNFHHLIIDLPILAQIRHTSFDTLTKDSYNIIVFGEHYNDLHQAIGILQSNPNAIEHFNDLDDLVYYLDKPDRRNVISIILVFDHEGQIPHITHKKIRPLMKLEDQCLLITDNVKMSRDYAKTIGFDELMTVNELDDQLEKQLSRLIRKGERLRDASLSRIKR